jgi:hypothetical protein
MNTLVIVLLAVFWAVGGILKARARKAEKAEAEDEERGVVKGPLRPTDRRATAKPVYKDKARGVAVWRPQPQRIRAGAKTLAEGVEPRQAKPSVAGRKAREPKTAVAKMAGVVRPSKAVPAAGAVRFPKAVPATGAVRAVVEKPMLEQLLLSAEEPDELRKAILYYEILGKPLSLREPVDDRLR